MKHFLHELRRMDVSYTNVRFTKSAAPGDGPIVMLSCQSDRVAQRDSVVESLRDLEYVRYLEDF